MYSARIPLVIQPAGGGPNTSSYEEGGSATVGAWYPDAIVVAEQARLGGQYAYAPGTALDAASADVMSDTISSRINGFSTLPTDPGAMGISGLRGSGISSSESLRVSTVFHPAARLVPSAYSDVASSNGFGSALLHDAAAPIAVNDDSAVLNIILHAIYDLPSAQFSPSFPTLVDAVDRMEPVYGVAPTRFILPATSSDLFAQLAWALAAAELVNDAKPDLSPHLLAALMKGFAGDIPCARCMHNFQTRLAEAAELWSNVPVSAFFVGC
ncbi:hypothetical protein BDZ89DRAFT_1060569 [Hymenopellis radicata]|nr:hypothetical protein BDZ89DRAFT_1060569 [Hymenopellis radicata]